MPRVVVSDPVSERRRYVFFLNILFLLLERRRARALKALDRKLAEISNEPEISLDGDDIESNVQKTTEPSA